MNTKTSFFVAALAAVLVLSITMTPALAAVAKDPFGDATNENPDFDIKKFGLNDDGDPYIDVYGTGAGTTVNNGDTIYAYVFVTDAGAFAVTSHGGIEDSTEVGDDTEFHGHLVTLGNVNDDTCVVGISETGDAAFHNARVSITGTGATSIAGALTASLSASTPNGICVTAVFDSV